MLAKTLTYCPGGYVLPPEDRMAEDQARGASAPVSLNVGVWLERFEAIDNVDWQSEVKYLRVFARLRRPGAGARYLGSLPARQGPAGRLQQGELALRQENRTVLFVANRRSGMWQDQQLLLVANKRSAMWQYQQLLRPLRVENADDQGDFD